MLTVEQIKNLYLTDGQRKKTQSEIKACELLGTVIVSALTGSKLEVGYWDCTEDHAVKIIKFLQDWGLPASIQHRGNRYDVVIPAFWIV